jgi:hypothetical protein
MVRSYVDVGVTEIHLLYPHRDEQLPDFERIAREVIPALKKEYET